MTEPPAMADDCEHAYETRLLGGHPITVRACVFCRTPDWADLMEQAVDLYRWGWQEGRAGRAERGTLSAYDQPRGGEPAAGLTPCTCRQALHDREHQHAPVPGCPWCAASPDDRPALAATCMHPVGDGGECPCPPSCGCCKVTAASPRRDTRQAAYDAVYAYIGRLGDAMPPDPVHRNAIIWRAVTAALDATAGGGAADNETLRGQIARVRRAVAERRTEVAEREADGMLPFGTPGASWCDAITVTCDRIDYALRVFPPPGYVRAEPAHDAGPTVAEAKADDRAWPLEKAGE